MITSGEETGKLPEGLVHLADDYDEQVEVMVASLGHLVQPIMMVLLGGIVFFIILAVYHADHSDDHEPGRALIEGSCDDSRAAKKCLQRTAISWRVSGRRRLKP